jgi:hypothetical protein
MSSTERGRHTQNTFVPSGRRCAGRADAPRYANLRWAPEPRLTSLSDQVRRLAAAEGAFYSYEYKMSNPGDVIFYLVVPRERLIFSLWCQF